MTMISCYELRVTSSIKSQFSFDRRIIRIYYWWQRVLLAIGVDVG